MSSNSVRWIAVGPTDRFRVFVVTRDVSTNLPRAIGNRREYASGQEAAVDLRKPEFHLIQPRRIGGREVQMDPRLRLKKRLNAFGLVRGQLVDDDVDLPVSRLGRHDVAQEVDERLAGMAGDRLPNDLSSA